MKQRISVEQLNELDDEQKKRLREWWKPADGDLFMWKWHQQFEGGEIVEEIGIYIEGEIRSCHEPDENSLPLISIGQMCQFMDEHSPIAYRVAMVQFYSPKMIVPNREEDNEKAELMMHMVNRIELCDYLWEAVKEVLK